MKLKKMPEFTVYSLKDANLNSWSENSLLDSRYQVKAHESLLTIDESEINFYTAIAASFPKKRSLLGILIPSLIALISLGSLSAMVVQEHSHLSPSSRCSEKVSFQNAPSSYN